MPANAQKPTEADVSPYDLVPYPSDAFPQTDPRRIACVARMFGLTAADPRKARVLELGCASGGNILPLAGRMPQAEFTGVDFSGVQIGEAERLAREYGVKNIRFEQMDLAKITPEFGTFDYIICHGVYSWVPPLVQAAILRVCRDNLSDEGVAFVSYNTYPGWKPREILRDSMLFHTRHIPYGPAKLASARGMLEFMRKTSPAGSTFRQILDEQGAMLANAADNYVLHDFLETNNRPCYFNEFNDRLEAAGLAYLAETDVFMMFAENFGAETQQALLNETNANQVLMEQYLDYCTNRAFRQTLIVKAERGDKIMRRIEAKTMQQFNYRGLFVGVEVDRADPKADLTFRTRRNTRLVARDAFGKAALLSLLERQPGTLNFQGWLSAIKARIGGPKMLEGPVEPGNNLSSLITQLVVGGNLDLFDEAVMPPLKNVSSPKADAFVRRQVSSGVTSIASPYHETTRLSVVETALVPKLDGTRTAADLVSHLQAEVASGRLQFQKDGAAIVGDDAVAAAARQHFEVSLVSLEQKAMLVR